MGTTGGDIVRLSRIAGLVIPASGGSTIQLSDITDGSTVNIVEYNGSSNNNIAFIKLQNTYVGANSTYNVVPLVRKNCIYQTDSGSSSDASKTTLGNVDPSVFTDFEDTFYPGISSIIEAVSISWFSVANGSSSIVSATVFIPSVTEVTNSGTPHQYDTGGAYISVLRSNINNGNQHWLRTGYKQTYQNRIYRYSVQTSGTTTSTNSTTTNYAVRTMFCLPLTTPVRANTDASISSDYVLV